MQLTIPSELGQVRFLGLAVRALLVELAYPEDEVASIELCLVEAVNNAIEHAYLEEAGHLVEVALCAEDGGGGGPGGARTLELVVRDRGRAIPEEILAKARAEAQAEKDGGDALEERHGFDGGDALGSLEIDVSALAEGGYGLRLIHQVMDEVGYRRDGEHNAMTMKKTIAAAAQAGEAVPKAAPDGAEATLGLS
jgi:serine/threonine-protein kinase RsbW